jgi:hypothetical protein
MKEDRMSSDTEHEVDEYYYKASAATSDTDHEVNDYYDDHHVDPVTVDFKKAVDGDDDSTIE